MDEKRKAGISPASMEGREARTERGRRMRWRTFAGKGVLAAAVVVGMAGCSFGGDLSEIEPGECITGDVGLYPLSGSEVLEVIDCAEANPTMDHKVVFTEEVVGESYPESLVEVSYRCVDEGGWILTPSSVTWENGDRVALCLELSDTSSF